MLVNGVKSSIKSVGKKCLVVNLKQRKKRSETSLVTFLTVSNKLKILYKRIESVIVGKREKHYCYVEEK